MQVSKDEAAKTIADYHRAAEDTILLIARYKSDVDEPENEPIRLLEINEATHAAGVVPVHFGPTRETPYSLVVIELTPDEYRDLKDGQLRLPHGWRLMNVLYKSIAEL